MVAKWLLFIYYWYQSPYIFYSSWQFGSLGNNSIFEYFYSEFGQLYLYALNKFPYSNINMNGHKKQILKFKKIYVLNGSLSSFFIYSIRWTWSMDLIKIVQRLWPKTTVIPVILNLKFIFVSQLSYEGAIWERYEAHFSQDVIIFYSINLCILFLLFTNFGTYSCPIFDEPDEINSPNSHFKFRFRFRLPQKHLLLHT